MQEVNIYVTVEKTAIKSVERGYAYLLECFVNDKRFTRYGAGEGNLTLHQATLKALAEAFGRLKCECWIHIYAEDVFVLNMIRTKLSSWAYEGFEKQIANKSLWKELWKNIRYCKVDLIPGKHEHSDWLKNRDFIDKH